MEDIDFPDKVVLFAVNRSPL